MSRKPVASILVQSGPTHYLQLPSGKVQFTPGEQVPLYSIEDLDAAKRALPSSQIKVRIFPRIEDAEPEAVPVIQEGSTEGSKKKGRRDQ